MRISRLAWLVRQLLPLTYRSRYTTVPEGVAHFTVWRMWLGRVFAVDDVLVA